jgi:hypothetical protein
MLLRNLPLDCHRPVRCRLQRRLPSEAVTDVFTKLRNLIIASGVAHQTIEETKGEVSDLVVRNQF